MKQDLKRYRCGKFYMLAAAVCLISGAYPLQFIDFNYKLMSMIVLIFITYYMVIEYKRVGALFVSVFYVLGFIAVAITSRFSGYHTNAVMAFQVATLVSIYYLYSYVSKNDQIAKLLYDNSMIDDLTKIYNKRYFRIKAEEELARAQRYQQRFAIILLDVDHFKEINDTQGHLFGDQILKAVATEVQDSIRKEDTFCRYGGDEFVVVVSNYNDISRLRIAERIQNSINRVNQALGENLSRPITVSFGFGVYPEDGQDLDRLFQRADQEMYGKKGIVKPFVQSDYIPEIYKTAK